MERKIVSGMMLTLLLIGTLTMAFKISPIHALPETTLYVDPSTTTILVDDNFSINVTVADVTDLSTFSFRLGYNTTILDFVSVWVPPPWEPPIIILEPDGYVYVSATSPVSFFGTGVLALISFHATAVGECLLDLCDTMLFDSASDVIPHTVIDGSVNISGRIKIGIIGPGWPQFECMKQAAKLARDWINGPGGGIVIDGVRYDVSLHFEYSDPTLDLPPVDPMERLITEEEVDFIIGGLRSGELFAMREVAMDYNKLFFICGADTNELVDCGAGTCGACVRCDYARYKYLFRVTPVNDTTRFLNLVAFLSGYVLPYRLAPLYGSPVKTAVVAENFDWTVDMYNALIYYGYLGPQANIVYAARTTYTPGSPYDFTTDLDAMHAAQVRLIVHIYTTPDTLFLVQQMAAHPIKAVLAGIDETGQISEFWTYTGGACQYETFLASSGTGTPVSEVSEPYTTAEFWDLYYATYGHAPMYTSFGAYDAIIAMHDMLEAQTGPTYIHPPFDTADADALVPIIEATDRESVLGRFKYTQYHDPFSNEYGATWEQGYVRPFVVQWQTSKLEVVWPMDQPYSKLWALPDETGKMYPYPPDVDQDGDIDFWDAMFVGNAFGGTAKPPDEAGDPKWFMVANCIDPAGYPVNLIDLYDALYVANAFGWTVELPLAYCDEAGHLIPP